MTLLLLLSHFSRVRLCVTPETAAYQAPLPMGFSRQEYWSGLPLPSPNIIVRYLKNITYAYYFFKIMIIIRLTARSYYLTC